MRFFTIVPETYIYVIERLGKFAKLLTPGFYPLIPFLDRIAYIHSFREKAIKVPR